ncbi:MAG: ABC-type transport auxiliary lipoprotein family protein [Thermoanaerobaculales bacterium]|jgi:hypothetical protein|nr:ABC-type transport auxiliary lipoprotein family protein [Thermoanaerobaculales bacterium]
MSVSKSIVLTLAVLAGCASAPKLDYYTLSVERSGEAGATLNFEVERLATTGVLAGDRILIRASPTRVEHFRTARWAGALGELVQQKLAIELGPESPGRPRVLVSGTVLSCGQLDAPGGPLAELRLEIELRDPARRRFETPLLRRTYQATTPVAGPSVEALVEALSRSAEGIAAAIAADAAALAVEAPELPPSP